MGDSSYSPVAPVTAPDDREQPARAFGLCVRAAAAWIAVTPALKRRLAGEAKVPSALGHARPEEPSKA